MGCVQPSGALCRAGAGPESLVTGDFNGDHKLDLAVPNPNSNNVSILLGNGDGTFRPAGANGLRCPPLIAVTYSFGGHMSTLCDVC